MDWLYPLRLAPEGAHPVGAEKPALANYVVLLNGLDFCVCDWSREFVVHFPALSLFPPTLCLYI